MEAGIDEQKRQLYAQKIIVVNAIKYEELMDLWKKSKQAKANLWQGYVEFEVSIYYLIWGQLLLNLINILDNEPNYIKAKKTYDPLLLLKVVKKVCQRGTQAKVLIINTLATVRTAFRFWQSDKRQGTRLSMA